MRLFYIFIFSFCCIFSLRAVEYKELHWDHLIPEAELEIMKSLSSLITNPHQPLDPNEGIRDDIASAQSQLDDPDVQGVMNSINVRPELNNTSVTIPGFVVPVETNSENAITEFFLVPYFGACIHVPPPPPNQIIYVSYDKGLDVQEIWMPFVVNGTLFTELLENDIAVSAYSIKADNVVEFNEE